MGIKAKFISFLYLNEIYPEFKRSLTESSWNEGWKDLFEHHTEEKYVSDAFIWDGTQEDWHFWDNVDTLWLKEIGHKKITGDTDNDAA